MSIMCTPLSLWWRSISNVYFYFSLDEQQMKDKMCWLCCPLIKIKWRSLSNVYALLLHSCDPAHYRSRTSRLFPFQPSSEVPSNFNFWIHVHVEDFGIQYFPFSTPVISRKPRQLPLYVTQDFGNPDLFFWRFRLETYHFLKTTTGNSDTSSLKIYHTKGGMHLFSGIAHYANALCTRHCSHREEIHYSKSYFPSFNLLFSSLNSIRAEGRM